MDVRSAIKVFKKQNDKSSLINFELGILYRLSGSMENAHTLVQKIKNEKCKYDFEFDKQKLAIEILSWIKDKELFVNNMKGIINKTRQL